MKATEFKKVKASILIDAKKKYVFPPFISEAKVCKTWEELQAVICKYIYSIIHSSIALPDGTYKCWWENGQISTEHPYVDGKTHGVYRSWDSYNGQLITEAPYVDGKRHGVYKSWYSKHYYEATYINGELQN